MLKSPSYYQLPSLFDGKYILCILIYTPCTWHYASIITHAIKGIHLISQRNIQTFIKDMTYPFWGGVSATKGIIYSSTPLGCTARRFGEVPGCEPRTLDGWQNVIAAAPKFGIDLEKKREPNAAWLIELKAQTETRLQWIFTVAPRSLVGSSEDYSALCNCAQVKI